MCLICCTPPSSEIANMSRSPGLQKITLSDLTLSLPACGLKAKDSTGFRYLQLFCMPERQQHWREHRTWPRCARYIAAHLSCSSMCWIVRLSLDPKLPCGEHSPSEEGATLSSPYILLDKRLYPPGRLFWEICSARCPFATPLKGSLKWPLRALKVLIEFERKGKGMSLVSVTFCLSQLEVLAWWR